MGIEVAVVDEQGTRISSIVDPLNILHRLLPTHADPHYQCLNRIDLYGDTTFNRYQIPAVKDELSRLVEAADRPDDVLFLNKLLALVDTSISEPHLYLKFYGD